MPKKAKKKDKKAGKGVVATVQRAVAAVPNAIAAVPGALSSVGDRVATLKPGNKKKQKKRSTAKATRATSA